MITNKKKYYNYLMLILFIGLFVFIFSASIKAQSVITHLEYLAHNITYETKPPSTLEELQKEKKDLREKFLKIINLYPLPEKTPLNVKYVGERVDLGKCYFQRVVFESRPKIYVAAHLYIPKNVTFPVPAVIHVPGHAQRDKNRAHPRTYAENGFVALALPMVGEEGKAGTGWGKCGEYGPYVGHFNWFNTGYSAIGPTVWDGIRAVDFLISLTDSTCQKLVKEDKIGMAGLSGGSARTLWTTIADPRISCASVNQGVTAISGYQDPGGISNTCDIHLFYNAYGMSYGELYSLIAPRPLLIQNGTIDKLFQYPKPVIAYLTTVYELYEKPEKFSYKVWKQGHGYTPNIWNTEDAWMNQWLRKTNTPIIINDTLFQADLTCFPDGQPSDMQNTEMLYTRPTPKWQITNIDEYKRFKDTLLKHLKEDVIPTAFSDIDVSTIRKKISNSEQYYTDQMELLIDKGTIIHKGYFFYKPREKRKTVILISQTNVNRQELEDTYKKQYAHRNLNLYCTEITGVGDNPWLNDKHYLYDRFAMLVGHTKTSLQIYDIIAAEKVMVQEKSVDPSNIYIWGKGDLAVPVLYAAVADSNISGVILENIQDKHIGISLIKESDCSTAIFNILKYADIPQVASLIYPRKITLVGEHNEGFRWTKNIYKMLNDEDGFIKTNCNTNNILDIATK